MRVFAQELVLRSPWTVAHGTSTSRINVFVDLGDGIGEAAIVPYYPYTEEEVTAWLRRALAQLADFPPAAPPDQLLASLPPGPPPARAAIDVALHDRWARRQRQPLHRLLSESDALPLSSYTLSIPKDEDAYVDRLKDLANWPLLKLKLGSGDAARDLRLIELARTYYGGQLCVDANAGWDVPVAIRMVRVLADAGVRFIEEPLREPSPANFEMLRDGAGPGIPPIITDESVVSESDLERLAPVIDGVNIKVAKAGGISAALRLIRRARAYKLKVLIGCMVESSVGVTAAAHLAPLADFADLDGHLQIANDPYVGVQVKDGRITLPETFGLGVTSRRS